MSRGIISLIVIFAYMAVLLIIGYLSWKKTARTREDYFLASRSFRTIVLFSAIFGANMSAFVLVGAPGLAYHTGYAAYGYGVGLFALIAPIFLYLSGYRLWFLGKKYGYITPAEALGDRFSSTAVTWVLFILWIYYTVPYLEISVIGGGIVFEAMSGNLIPYWAGATITLAVVFIYVWQGGMRGAAWVNVFQVALFMGFLIFAFFFIAYRLGGFSEATAKMPIEKLWIVGKGPFKWQSWVAFPLFITGFLVGGLPYLIMRVMSAASGTNIKRIMLIYPAAVTCTWFPPCIIGAWGSGIFPGLVGAQSDKILPMMMAKFAPAWVTGMLGAAILAAIMSTLDGQLLTSSNMLASDVILRVKKDISQVKEVTLCRVFLLAMCAAALMLAIFRVQAIFRIAEVAFSGFACMTPAIVGAQYWKRCSKWGFLTSIIVSNIALHLFYYVFPKPLPSWATLGGFPPVVPGLVISLVLLVVVSLLTKPTEDKVKKWWDIIDKVEANG